jgi:nucleoid-associated protein YgaU
MKPLVLFSSLAVLCASGLLALSYKGWQDDPSALTSLSAETKRVQINSAVPVSNPPTAQPSTEVESVATKKAEEKVAAVDSKQTETKPTVEAAPSVKPEDPEAKPNETEAAAKGATFDIVRVEEDGSAVLAGRAAPGDKVRLLIDEEVAGETEANDRGEWVIIPVNSMPAGAHQMQIETENASGEVKRAEQSVALTVPDQPGTQPLIVLSETAKPSQVLQKPVAPEVKQAEAAQNDSSTEPVATPADVANEGDVAEEKVADNEASSSSSAEQPAPETKTAALEPSVAAKSPTSVPTERNLAVDVVDYDEAGLTTFSGRSTPDSRVRVYVDNRFVGEAPAASDGTWSFTAGSEIASGPHTLRTDEISTAGKVSARIELPFFRESPERIASLQAQRNVTAEEDNAKPQTKPEMATEPDSTTKAAAVDAGVEPEPAESTATTDEAVVAAEPEDNVTATTEEKVAAPVQQETVATQQTSGLKADAETVESPAATTMSESSTSQQAAAAGAATEPAKPEPSQQTAAVETATEPADPEPSQQTAAVETATEPAKPEPSQQTAAVETATEPAEPEPSQQTAAVETATEPAEPVQEAVKPVAPESTMTGDAVETAAVTPAPEKAEAAAPSTGRVVIQPGNNLWQISRVIYGKGRQYTVIYEANKSQIRDPDMIYPGQIFNTPGSDAPEEIDPACRRPLAECQ